MKRFLFLFVLVSQVAQAQSVNKTPRHAEILRKAITKLEKDIQLINRVRTFVVQNQADEAKVNFPGPCHHSIRDQSSVDAFFKATSDEFMSAHLGSIDVDMDACEISNGVISKCKLVDAHPDPATYRTKIGCSLTAQPQTGSDQIIECGVADGRTADDGSESVFFSVQFGVGGDINQVSRFESCGG